MSSGAVSDCLRGNMERADSHLAGVGHLSPIPSPHPWNSCPLLCASCEWATHSKFFKKKKDVFIAAFG